LVIDGRDVQFSNEPDGWHQAVIDVLCGQFRRWRCARGPDPQNVYGAPSRRPISSRDRARISLHDDVSGEQGGRFTSYGWPFATERRDE
jgi:hypothetical protein